MTEARTAHLHMPCISSKIFQNNTRRRIPYFQQMFSPVRAVFLSPSHLQWVIVHTSKDIIPTGGDFATNNLMDILLIIIPHKPSVFFSSNISLYFIQSEFLPNLINQFFHFDPVHKAILSSR